MNRAAVAGARLAALKMLASVLDSGGNLGDAEKDNTLEDTRDRAFARHLAYGVLRRLSALEWLSAQLLRKPLRRKDRDIQRLILIGLYELWAGDSAAHAAIHESAEGARKLGKTWAVSVVNAVLRRFQREQEEWIARLNHTDERLAHPDWLLTALRKDWPVDWLDIAEANNQPAPLWLRLNPGFDAGETLNGLEQAGFKVERHPVAREAVKVTPAAAVNALPGFRQGHFSVQDPAAQLAAGLLRCGEGHRVLDACAAPGGKTCHLLETAPPGMSLTALDQSPVRLKLIEENIERLGLGKGGQIELRAADACEPGAWWDGVPYERILLDAPCSATGVIRRHPEIKWLRTPAQVAEASELQSRLLKQLWPLLKAGGILLYATCSVLKDENNRQIEGFLEHHADAKLVDIDEGWGRNTGFGQQVLPGDQEMDGFFYACLLKNP